jgi:hypothetical protein
MIIKFKTTVLKILKKKNHFFYINKDGKQVLYIVNLVIMVRLRLVIVIDRVGSKRDPYNMELYNTLINIKKKRIFFFFLEYV